MKLYATTTSERATKGQGGNEYLVFRLYKENGEIRAVFLIKENTIEGAIDSDNENVKIKSTNILKVKSLNKILTEEKGKQQKGD